MKKIKQVTFDEAFSLVREGVKVYAIDPEKPSLKLFYRFEICEAIRAKDKLVYLIFEEA